MGTEISRRSWKLAAPVVVILSIAALTACAPEVVEEEPEASCIDDGTTLQLDCPALPYTNAVGTIDKTTGILDYDIWAWNSFAAMNWPALQPADNNNQRGFPDLSQSFATAKSTDLAVWETLKEKREVFLADPFTGEPVPHPQVLPWNAAPQYGPGNSQIPDCPGHDSTLYERIQRFERHIANNTGDETAEVASEARESMAVLCKGHDPTMVPCNPDPPLGGALIHGSPVGPRVWRGQPSAGLPLIYEVKVNWDFYDYIGTFTDPGKLWAQDNARAAALAGNIRLPARTSVSAAPPRPGTGFNTAATPPPGPVGTPGPNKIVANYSASGCLSDNFEKVTPTSSLTPCPAGSVHLKAAWMPLDLEKDDPEDFHTAELLYYTDKGQVTPENPDGLCKQPGLFGLVGLHIIQRIHEKSPRQSDQGHSSGGTFIFATWEHVQNDDQGFTYANLYPTTSDEPDPYPNVKQAGIDGIPLNRAYEILPSTQKATAAVHQALACADPEAGSQPSVWCNYELVGVQHSAANGPPGGFDTTNPPDALPTTPQPGIELPADSGQQYFLANLVIESNVGLQQFLGQPPATMPISHYTNPKIPPGGPDRASRTGNARIPANASPGFLLTNANLASRIAPRDNPAWDNGQKGPDNKGVNQPTMIKKGGSNSDNPGRKIGAYNMGGCMGCHGVAQIRGYSFSFVLLDNQEGAAPDTQIDVMIPPPPTSPTH